MGVDTPERRGEVGMRGDPVVARREEETVRRVEGVMSAEPSSGVGGERGEPPEAEEEDDSVSQCTATGVVLLRLGSTLLEVALLGLGREARLRPCI